MHVNRAAARLIGAVMAVALLVGCGSPSTNSSATDAPATVAPTQPPAPVETTQPRATTPPKPRGLADTPNVREAETLPLVKVVDGDTVQVGRNQSVRIIGIDTPETYAGEECGGWEATRAMEKMVTLGQNVTLFTDDTQDTVDRYGRLLRYVQTSDGVDIGRAQVASGAARVYVYANTPFAMYESYAAAENTARAAGLGQWAC